MSGVTAASSDGSFDRISNDCLDASGCEIVERKRANATFHSVCERTMSGCCCTINVNPLISVFTEEEER